MEEQEYSVGDTIGEFEAAVLNQWVGFSDPRINNKLQQFSDGWNRGAEATAFDEERLRNNWYSTGYRFGWRFGPVEDTEVKRAALEWAGRELARLGYVHAYLYTTLPVVRD